jgi:hypothetical protein
MLENIVLWRALMPTNVCPSVGRVTSRVVASLKDANPPSSPSNLAA